MSSLFGHALAGLTVAGAFTAGRPPRRLAVLAVACAVAPDLDWFTGLLPLDPAALAHRGLSHSLVAEVLLAALAVALGARDRWRDRRVWACLLAAALSHSLLDAFTFGGTGVAFLWPFTEARFVSAWQPLFVTPIPLSERLTDWLLFSLGTELLWIGTPALLVLGGPRVLALWRRRAAAR